MTTGKSLFEQFRLECGMDDDDVKAARWYKDGLIDFADWILQQKLQQTPVSLSAPPSVDWKRLRAEYFSECVVRDTVDGLKLRIDFAPHDLFEWFKRKIEAGRQLR